MAPTPRSSPSPWPSTPAPRSPCASRSPKSAPSAPSSSSTPFIFNTATAPSPTSPTSPSPSSASACWPPSSSSTSTAGTARSAPPATRTSSNPAGIFPDFGAIPHSRAALLRKPSTLFATYQRVSAAVLDLLRRRIARPESLKPEAYERTLSARAFDVARYLLPLATNTSLGQIVSARTLETQVSRLLSHPAAEIRLLGAEAPRSRHRPRLEPQRPRRPSLRRQARRIRKASGREGYRL